MVSATPRWASFLVASVCARYHVSQPTLRWRNALDYPSAIWITTGDYNPTSTTVTIYASGVPLTNRINLIHELAHHIHFLRTSRDDHSELFWRYCWTLYRLYSIPLHAAVLSEFAYMARSEQVLLSMGVRLSPQARLAAALGRSLRAQANLQTRVRSLRTRLSTLRSPRKRTTLRRSLRPLILQAASVERVQARHARAYKRVARNLSV